MGVNVFRHLSWLALLVLLFWFREADLAQELEPSHSDLSLEDESPSLESPPLESQAPAEQAAPEPNQGV